MRLLLCGAVFLASLMLVMGSNNLETVFQWRYLDYVWPSEEARQEAIRKGDYILDKPIPMDIDVARDGRVFITSLGIAGTPARLGYVSNLKGPSGPLIQPYPNWNWTDRNDCDSIIEVYRIAIDECNRLWVLDSAVLIEGKLRRCQPKLLAFDLETDTLVTKVVIPENIATNAKTNESLFVNVKVETDGPNCEKTTVFMAEGRGNGLVIWDGIKLRRIESPEFNPQKKAEKLTIANETITLPIGIVGLDISPRIFPGEPRHLYFRPLSSYDLFHADTEELRNSVAGKAIRIYGGKNVLSSQSFGHAFSPEGTLFFGLAKEIAISCWNRYRELKRENFQIVAQDKVRLPYTNGIKVIPSQQFPDGELWLLSNGWVHNSFLKKLNKNQINYRILRSPVKKLIAGTKCEMPQHLKRTLQCCK